MKHNVPSTYWPVIILLFIELLLAITNYHANTYLMGWDNVMPEFNFKQAFITNIFGVWQEHRGVGLPDGMGHAANLMHTAFLWILSLALPQNVLRYTFHFFMHLLGMIGMYALFKNIFKTKILPIIGALFYGLNLITIQMFYTPLEAFSIHFAALPWLALTLLRYYQSPNKYNLIYFGVVVLLSTPQFFIPTLLLPTSLLLIALSTPYIKQWKQVRTAGALFLCINAFWLLPYIYNLPFNAPVIQSAKINQMSSNEVYERNQAFGDIKNVLLMRGFMLDFEDVNTEGQPIFVMNTWRTWINQPLIQIAGVLFALCILAGLFTKVVNTSPTGSRLTTSGFKVIWVLSFLFLANNTPYVSTLMEWLRLHVPLFAEAYRFPFTKFGLLYGFASTVLIVNIFKFERRPLLKLIIIVLIFIAALPVFQGQFFYNAIRVTLPKDYTKLFTFMDTQNHNGRVAYLPSPSYWSWKHYNFGLVGSGFVWYGLSQPIMDRAFDPWSNVNENYYWELTHALYRNIPEELNAVFSKYDIQYIIYDKNIWAQSNDRSLLNQELPTLLSSLPNTKIINQLENMNIYERKINTNSFIRSVNALPIITPYQWTDNDVAYTQVGDYIASSTADNIYPYRSLFTKRSVDKREFSIPEVLNTITAHVFEASASSTLTKEAVKPCGVLKTGVISSKIIDDALEIRATDQRACISIGAPELFHQEGYLVKVESKNIQGRPLTVSIINNTAKHVEIETVLKGTTNYFILPPLASDGLGYTVYFANDSIGQNETINSIKTIDFYTIPYQEMTNSKNITHDISLSKNTNSIKSVNHPNSAYYNVILDYSDTEQTLILSQSYNSGWLAFSLQTRQFLPHVLINNWSNGWILDKIYKPASPAGRSANDKSTNAKNTVIIFFWPQLLEWAGLSILIITGIIIFFPARNR